MMLQCTRSASVLAWDVVHGLWIAWGIAWDEMNACLFPLVYLRNLDAKVQKGPGAPPPLAHHVSLAWLVLFGLARWRCEEKGTRERERQGNDAFPPATRA